MADNFPLKSSEFVKGTPRFNDYISAIDKVRGSVGTEDSFPVQYYCKKIYIKKIIIGEWHFNFTWVQEYCLSAEPQVTKMIFLIPL